MRPTTYSVLSCPDGDWFVAYELDGPADRNGIELYSGHSRAEAYRAIIINEGVGLAEDNFSKGDCE